MNEDIKYLVAKETYRYVWCQTCNGSGKTQQRFQNRISHLNCRTCGGTGKQKITHRTEVSLIEAVEALKGKGG